MRIIGLTGGIGMGKSTAAKALRGMGLPVYHADKAVHDLLRKGGAAVKPVAKLFPEALKRGGIDRKTVGHIVFNHPAKLKKLEKILHPLVREAENEFLKKARAARKPAAVLEIPLLFETGGEKRCDVVLTVTAPKTVQKARVLARRHMTPERLKGILARQMPDALKRKKADYIIHTGKGLADTRAQLERVMSLVLQ